MVKKKLRVGVIGAGAIAEQRHLPNWQELESEGRVELAAVCDVRKDRATKMTEVFGGKTPYTDFKTMLDKERLDVVDICTHNRFHCDATIKSLAAGAHVLVEKPMAMSVKEAERMLAASKKAKRKLMVAQHMRFASNHEKLKKVIESGELGSIYTARATYLRRRGIPGWGKFHIKSESLGGPLIDVGVHMIDLCYWLMGSPKPVSASGQTYTMFGNRKGLINKWGVPYKLKEFDVEDYATALVRFEGELTMNVDVSWAANIGDNEHHGVTILGDKAGINTNPPSIHSTKHGALTTTTLDWVPDQEPHRMEIRHFIECVEKNLPVRVKPEESVNVQKIIDAIYASSARNKEVAIK